MNALCALYSNSDKANSSAHKIICHVTEDGYFFSSHFLDFYEIYDFSMFCHSFIIVYVLAHSLKANLCATLMQNKKKNCRARERTKWTYKGKIHNCMHSYTLLKLTKLANKKKEKKEGGGGRRCNTP